MQKLCDRRKKVKTLLTVTHYTRRVAQVKHKWNFWQHQNNYKQNRSCSIQRWVVCYRSSYIKNYALLPVNMRHKNGWCKAKLGSEIKVKFEMLVHESDTNSNTGNGYLNLYKAKYWTDFLPASVKTNQDLAVFVVFLILTVNSEYWYS